MLKLLKIQNLLIFRKKKSKQEAETDECDPFELSYKHST